MAPKEKLTLSIKNPTEFKAKLKAIGESFMEQGIDVWDRRHDQISLSQTLQVLVERTFEALASENE